MLERVLVENRAGRRLEVEVDGPPDGLLLLSHTGTPSGGRLYAPRVQAGAQRGIRHAVYSRPGYGGSDRHEGRMVADCASDVAAIADALGAGEVLIEGGSGGGPHALACAALLPERVLAAASIAGVAPFDAQGLDWMEGMGRENVEEFGAAGAGGEQLAEYLERETAEMLGATGPQLHAALGDLLSDVDVSALSGDYAEWLAQSINAGLAPGIWGWFDDDLAFLKDWRDRAPGDDLAGRPGPLRAAGAWRVARRARPRGPRPPAARARPPVAVAWSLRGRSSTICSLPPGAAERRARAARRRDHACGPASRGFQRTSHRCPSGSRK